MPKTMLHFQEMRCWNHTSEGDAVMMCGVKLVPAVPENALPGGPNDGKNMISHLVQCYSRFLILESNGNTEKRRRHNP